MNKGMHLPTEKPRKSHTRRPGKSKEVKPKKRN